MKKNEIKSGVYKIQNTQNGRAYIGASKKVRERFDEHRCTLRKGKHRSEKLQSDWDNYSEEDFIFEMIEEVHDRKNRNEREKYYINLYDSCDNGYNSNLGGSGLMPGKMKRETREKISNAKKGKSLSDETRAKMGIARKGKKVSDEGKKHQSEAKLGCKNPRAVFNEEYIREIRYLVSQGHTQTAVAKAFGVSQGAISNIVNGKRYGNVSWHLKLDD